MLNSTFKEHCCYYDAVTPVNRQQLKSSMGNVGGRILAILGGKNGGYLIVDIKIIQSHDAKG